MKKIFSAIVLLVGGVAHADGWLGLELGDGARGGVLVRGTVEGSPAAQAQLHPGDEVTAVGAIKVSKPADLVQAVRGAALGRALELTVSDAAGRARAVSITPVQRPSDGALQKNLLVDKEAPDFAPNVVAGPKLGKLSSLRGQVVLIDFFATWCGPCVAALPHVQRMHAELGRRGLRVVGLSSESPEIVAGAAARWRLGYSLAADEGAEVASRFHVYGLPTMAVIDKRGVVREISVNDLAAAERAVRAALDAPN